MASYSVSSDSCNVLLLFAQKEGMPKNDYALAEGITTISVVSAPYEDPTHHEAHMASENSRPSVIVKNEKYSEDSN